MPPSRVNAVILKLLPLETIINHLLSQIHTNRKHFWFYVIKLHKLLRSVFSKHRHAVASFTKNTHFLPSATHSEVSLFNTFTVHITIVVIYHTVRAADPCALNHVWQFDDSRGHIRSGTNVPDKRVSSLQPDFPWMNFTCMKGKDKM